MRPRAIDLIVAGVATIVEISLLYDDGTHPAARGLVLTVLAGAALMARRQWPLAVLAATVAEALALAALGDSPAGAPALVALFAVADARGRRVTIAATLGVAVALQAASVASPPVAVIAALLGGYWQTYRQGMQERAQVAVQAERAAIARELHDIVAHSVTVMLVGARGARDVLRSDPDAADDALARVEASGEESLVELRRILGLLRDGRQEAERRPQPSLADLETLVEEFRTAGLPAALRVTGEPRPLPGGIELSGYRIVQEALTNALRHAKATSVVVGLAYREHLEIEVVDDGISSGDGVGHGLIGLRERVALLGGEVETRRLPGGGFRVAARLPL